MAILLFSEIDTYLFDLYEKKRREGYEPKISYEKAEEELSGLISFSTQPRFSGYAAFCTAYNRSVRKKLNKR